MSRIITFGEVMGRLAAPGYKRLAQTMPGMLEVTFAGAEVNVAASIARLGGDASFVSALPGHAIGDAVVANLRAVGIDTKHTLRTSDGRLGLFYHEAGINQRPGNVIYDRAGSSFAVTSGDAYDWEGIFEGAGWFHISGITPAISANAAGVAQRAVQEASSRGLPVSCDMNYRSKLWQWDPSLPPHQLAARTMGEVLPFVTVFMGGLEDAAMLLGIRAGSGADDPLLDTARQIAARFPRLTHVAMTLRDVKPTHQTWGGMIYDAALDKSFYAPWREGRFEPYIIEHIVDRLGAGDAFAAGLIFSLTNPEQRDPQSAVAFATAVSCLAHSIEGDFSFISRAEVDALLQGGSGGGVNR
jgi:2-dehydro-3-deoxygluconokinase